MINCGTDIVEIDRIEKAVKTTPGFLEKVFSGAELEYFREFGERFEILAGFFAAKEAFSKFLKTGVRGFELRDVSVKHENGGAPYIEFFGERQNVSLSISHNKTCAVAIVCGAAKSLYCDELAQKMGGLLKPRRSDANKGDFGRITVIAGSRGMTGAAVLSAYSALRTGSGLVTLATAESEAAVAASYYAEIMTRGLAAENGIISDKAILRILELTKNANAVVFGPGLGQSDGIVQILESLLCGYTGKLLIDADGLNALKRNVEVLKKKTCEVILTPHPGEMSRLCGVSIPDIQNNRRGYAENFAKEYGVCLVLKGEKTVVAMTGEETFVNPTGNPGMATAGTGDVLSGVIASLWGQGLKTFDAAALGVYIHGLAGDIAKEDKGSFGLVSGDVAEMLPYAIKRIVRD